jgi:hypothetical protein
MLLCGITALMRSFTLFFRVRCASVTIGNGDLLVLSLEPAKPGTSQQWWPVIIITPYTKNDQMNFKICCLCRRQLVKLRTAW